MDKMDGRRLDQTRQDTRRQDETRRDQTKQNETIRDADDSRPVDRWFAVGRCVSVTRWFDKIFGLDFVTICFVSFWNQIFGTGGCRNFLIPGPKSCPDSGLKNWSSFSGFLLAEFWEFLVADFRKKRCHFLVQFFGPKVVTFLVPEFQTYLKQC